jgi:hypothetical protein
MRLPASSCTATRLPLVVRGFPLPEGRYTPDLSLANWRSARPESRDSARRSAGPRAAMRDGRPASSTWRSRSLTAAIRQTTPAVSSRAPAGGDAVQTVEQEVRLRYRRSACSPRHRQLGLEPRSSECRPPRPTPRGASAATDAHARSSADKLSARGGWSGDAAMRFAAALTRLAAWSLRGDPGAQHDGLAY